MANLQTDLHPSQTLCFFFDIDGTTYQTSIHDNPQTTIETMIRLKQSGHKLVVCTSRSYAEMANLSFTFTSLLDAIICSDGAQVISPSTNYHTSINQVVASNVACFLDKYNVIYRWVDGTGQGYLNRHVPDIDALFDYEYLMVPPTKQIVTSDVIHFVYYTNSLNIVKYIHKIAAKEKVLDFSYVHHIYPFRTGKGITAMRFAEELGIPHENTIAFGDGANDVELLQMSHIGIAMGNACTACKEVSNYVTTRIEENGIQNACKHFGWI